MLSESVDPAVIASVMRALSNPNRLKIFLLLRDQHIHGEAGFGLRVGEISGNLEITLSTVSHHLRELEQAGLIQLERRGRNVFCSIAPHPLADVLDRLDCGLSG